MKWMVMASTTLTTSNSNQKRCFDTNATDLASKELATAEAERRNAAEREAGHGNVFWFACEQLDLEALMMALA